MWDSVAIKKAKCNKCGIEVGTSSYKSLRDIFICYKCEFCFGCCQCH